MYVLLETLKPFRKHFMIICDVWYALVITGGPFYHGALKRDPVCFFCNISSLDTASTYFVILNSITFYA